MFGFEDVFPAGIRQSHTSESESSSASYDFVISGYGCSPWEADMKKAIYNEWKG